MEDVIEGIKKVAEEEGIVVWKPMNLKVNKYDKKAIEIIEMLQEDGYQVGEAIEILQSAICWLGIITSSVDADEEIDEGKANKNMFVLTKKT